MRGEPKDPAEYVIIIDRNELELRTTGNFDKLLRNRFLVILKSQVSSLKSQVESQGVERYTFRDTHLRLSDPSKL